MQQHGRIGHPGDDHRRRGDVGRRAGRWLRQRVDPRRQPRRRLERFIADANLIHIAVQPAVRLIVVRAAADDPLIGRWEQPPFHRRFGLKLIPLTIKAVQVELEGRTIADGGKGVPGIRLERLARGGVAVAASAIDDVDRQAVAEQLPIIAPRHDNGERLIRHARHRPAILGDDDLVFFPDALGEGIEAEEALNRELPQLRRFNRHRIFRIADGVKILLADEAHRAGIGHLAREARKLLDGNESTGGVRRVQRFARVPGAQVVAMAGTVSGGGERRAGGAEFGLQLLPDRMVLEAPVCQRLGQSRRCQPAQQHDQQEPYPRRQKTIPHAFRPRSLPPTDGH